MNRDQETLIKAFITLWHAGCASTIDTIMEVAGISAQPEFFEPLTCYQYEKGKACTASEYLRSLTVIQRLGRETAAFHTKYDLWMTAVLAEPPVALGTFDVKLGEAPDRAWERIIAFAPLTALQNATGQPAPCRSLFSGARRDCRSVRISLGVLVTRRHFSGWQPNLSRQDPGQAVGHRLNEV